MYYSGLEETTVGVPEESFVSGIGGNFWAFDQPVQGLAVAGSANGQTLLILCGGRLYGIVGNSLDTFRRFLISNRRGCRNLTAVASLGGMVAWRDSSGQVWGTDGSSLQEIGLSIRPDLTPYTPGSDSMTFHVSGTYHWLVLSTGSKIYVYDMDTEQWMPPWSFSCTYIYSGEIAPGSYQLFGCTATNSLTLSTTSHNDNGAFYTPTIKTNLNSMVPDTPGAYDEPSRTGTPWYFQIDTNNGSLADVLFQADDDPLNSSTAYTSIFSQATTTDAAWNRNNGTFLVQNVFAMIKPMSRWIGWQFKGLMADDNLKIYGWFCAYETKK